MKTLFICGGSASGKTYLARMIQRQIGTATLLSQDAFYCDRPSGSAADRHEFDFDQPGAIDWPAMKVAIGELCDGQTTDIPIYDFNVSLRAGSQPLAADGDVLIVDGTLILSQPDLAAMSDVSVFVRAPEDLRRARREYRDVEERGRTITFVRQQLAEQVFPAHEEHVEPSARHVDLILEAEDIMRDPEGSVRQVLALLGKTG
ncbi:MAG: uridine kinase [Pseudomonadota bacterium]